MSPSVKILARNRKARFDYHIEETYEAGMALQGTEVKSIRLGRVNLKDSFALIENGEVFLYNMHVAPYRHGNRYNHEPERKRKLLLHRQEIRGLLGKTTQKGSTLVPLSIYLKHNLIKVELALVKGKKKYDKRRDLIKKEAQRDIQRAFKERQQEE